jgi:hypothetical protein
LKWHLIIFLPSLALSHDSFLASIVARITGVIHQDQLDHSYNSFKFFGMGFDSLNSLESVVGEEERNVIIRW